MSKIIKLGFWAVAILALIVIAAVVAVSLILDPDDYKARIEQALQETTGRAVEIQGDISLAVFPRLGVRVGRVVLANVPGFSEPTFASVEQIRLNAKLIPLLRRRLEVGSVLLDGLRVNLLRDQNQRGSWEGLGESTQQRSGVSPPSEPAPQAPERVGENQAAPLIADFSIGALELKNGRIRWHDVATAQRYTLEDVSLQTGVIRPGEPIAVKMASGVVGDPPALKGDLAMQGELEFDPDTRILNLEGLELNADALVDSPPAETALALTGDVAVDLANHTLNIRSFVAKPKLQGGAAAVAVRATLTGGLDGDWIAGTYNLRGLEFSASVDDRQQSVGPMELTGGASADLNLAEQTLNVPYLNLSALGLKLTGALEGEQLLQTPRVEGILEVAQFDLWPLLKRFGYLPPETADLGAFDDASLQTQFSAGPHSINLAALIARLGDTVLEGSVGATDFKGPSLRFDLAINAIDVNRYLPAPIDRKSTDKTTPPPAPAGKDAGTAAPKSPKEDPFEPLRRLDVDGRLRVGKLTAGKVLLSDVDLPVRAESGVIVFSPVKANLFGGSYAGNIGLDVSAQEPRAAVNDRFTAVQAGPLLMAVAGQDRLTGVADAAVKLTFQGRDADEIRQSLNGTTRFSFREGALKGVNIGRLLREAEAAIRGKPLAPDTEPVQTDFSELNATVHFTNGVARSDDLKAKSPLLRLSGEGTADLTREELDYLLTAVLVASPQGQGGKEMAELQGVPVPIRVTGTFAKPDFAVDLKTLLQAQAEAITEEQKEELQEKIEKEIEKKLNKPLPDGAKDLLRKLF